MTAPNITKLQHLLELDRVADQASGAVLFIDITSDEWLHVEGVDASFVPAAETDKLAFPDNAFDVVVALPKPGEPVHLDECLRVLRDDGKLIFRRAQRDAEGLDERDQPFLAQHLSNTAASIGCAVEAVIPYGLLCDNHSLYQPLGERAEAVRAAINDALSSSMAMDAWRIIELAVCKQLPFETSSRHMVVARKTAATESPWQYAPTPTQDLVEHCHNTWAMSFQTIRQVLEQNSHPSVDHFIAVLLNQLGDDMPEGVARDFASLVDVQPESQLAEPEEAEVVADEAPSVEEPTLRFLCVPDWRLDTWKDPIEQYLNCFSSSDNVALVLRIEPLLPELAELAQRLVTAIISNCGRPVEDSPDIIVEATPLEEDQEYLLYGSCHAYLPCEGGHEPTFLAKCEQYNLPVIEDIRALAASLATPTDEQPETLPEPHSHSPLSAIVVTHNSEAHIGAAIEGLLKGLKQGDELLIVDNFSSDQTTAIAEQYQEYGVQIIRNSRDLGFGNGLMVGAQQATHPHVLVVKPNAVLYGSVIDRLMTHMEAHANVAAVGPTTDIIISDQHVSMALPGIDLQEFDGHTIASAAAEIRDGLATETKLLASGCTLYRRDALLDVAPEVIDLFSCGEDLVISYELRKRGHRLLVAQDTFVTEQAVEEAQDGTNVKHHYLNRQAANAVYERLYRDYNGQVPSGEEVFGVQWFAPQTGKASIIILAYNNVNLTIDCIHSVYEHTQREFELILVDNGSGDEMASFVAELKQTRDNVIYIRNSINQGYAYGCNQGITASSGEYIVLLNNDIIVTPGWLSKQLAALSLDDSIGIVGPRTNFAGGPQIVPNVPYTTIPEMIDYAYEWATDHAGQIALLPRITGLCMVMPRRLIEAIGGLDTSFGIGNFEDDDLCLRTIRAGFKIALANDVFIHHYGSATFRSMNCDYDDIMRGNHQIYCAKWGAKHDITEAYNIVELAQSEPFLAERDYIAPEFSHVFNPQCTPINIEGEPAARFLCIPDWENEAWKAIVLSYIENTPNDGKTALILRVEPCTPERVESAIEKIGALFQAYNIDASKIPDIILETSTIYSGDRGSLYTACDVLIPCDGKRAHVYLREAKACGMAVAGEQTAAQPTSRPTPDAVLV